MAKVGIAMSFQQALLTKFKTRLVTYMIPFEEKKVWQNIGGSGFRKILEVQYIIDKSDLAILDMNDAMSADERVNFEVREYA